MASEYIQELNDNTFDAAIAENDMPVLVDFWAAWCGPCRAIAPILDELAQENHGKFKICKLNVDENNDIAMRYKVMSIPTMILFKGGQAVDKSVGLRPKEDILSFAMKHV